MHVEDVVERWTRDDDVAMTDKDGGGTRSGTVAAGSYVERVFESVASRSRRAREDSTSTTCSEQAAEDEFDQWLWEAYQLAQGQGELEHEYEAAGELSDCMYHHAQGGLHGRGRVRMFLPALNKGTVPNLVIYCTSIALSSHNISLTFGLDGIQGSDSSRLSIYIISIQWPL